MSVDPRRVAHDLVTVVIPALNAERTIERAIQSARQYVGDRVIVVDDGSSDRTAVRARSLGASVIEQENQGASLARATGLRAVATPYVIFLDSDDHLLSGWYIAFDEIRRNDGVVAVAGSVVRSGHCRTRVIHAPSQVETTRSLLLRPYGPFPLSAAICRVELLNAAMPGNPKPLNLRYGDDFELLIRASTVGQLRTVAAEFVCYTVSGGKSTLNAMAAAQGAEKVRRYYAAALQVRITPLTELEIKQAATRRLMVAAYYDQGIPGVMRIAASSPRTLATMVARRYWPGRAGAA